MELKILNKAICVGYVNYFETSKTIFNTLQSI